MNFQVLWEADRAVQIHVLTVFVAIVLTLVILFSRKGTGLHKVLGRIWAVMMLITASVSFFIHDLNPPTGFSWIHLLSLVTLFSVSVGWWAARHGNIRRHKVNMLAVVIGGLVIAGGFTFMPGRIMHSLFFGG